METRRAASPQPFVSPQLVELRSERLFDFFDLEALEDVELFDVVLAVERDTAVEAFFDVAHVVLEAFQAAELAGPDHFAVAHVPDLRGAADDAVDHHATCHDAGLAELEDLAHLGL